MASTSSNHLRVWKAVLRPGQWRLEAELGRGRRSPDLRRPRRVQAVEAERL